MVDIIPIRTKIQESALKLHHKYKGRPWFVSSKAEDNIIMIEYKKGCLHLVDFSLNTVFDDFVVKIKEHKELEPIDFKLKK